MEHFSLGYNVLVNFCPSVEVSFATSKTRLDLQHNNLCIRAASRDVKRLNTQEPRKLDNDSKSLELVGDADQSPASLLETLVVEVCAKGDITFFWSYPILPDVLTVCQIFCPELSEETSS